MRPDYIKIKTLAVAINPTDLYHVTTYGPIGGCDVSGVVLEVGEACKADVKKGDNVFAVVHGANYTNVEDGSQAEFAMIKDGHIAKIPDGMNFEDAATLGVGITTIGHSLYRTLNLPLPTEPTKTPFTILIYGGSTATGTLAIQYAKMSGLTVITTASPNNFDLVKSLGADVVFDYHDLDCAEKIRAYTNNSLRYVLDCISQEWGYKICAGALSSDSSQQLHCVTLLPADSWPREDVTPQVVFSYTSFGEDFVLIGMTFPAQKDHFDYGVMFWRLSAKILADGKIKTHPTTIGKDGLQGVVQG